MGAGAADCPLHYDRASKHPSVYVIEGKRLSDRDAVPGDFAFCRALGNSAYPGESGMLRLKI
jgi:hypothetical protein